MIQKKTVSRDFFLQASRPIRLIRPVHYRRSFIKTSVLIIVIHTATCCRPFAGRWYLLRVVVRRTVFPPIKQKPTPSRRYRTLFCVLAATVSVRNNIRPARPRSASYIYIGYSGAKLVESISIGRGCGSTSPEGYFAKGSVEFPVGLSSPRVRYVRKRVRLPPTPPPNAVQ